MNMQLLPARPNIDLKFEHFVNWMQTQPQDAPLVSHPSDALQNYLSALYPGLNPRYGTREVLGVEEVPLLTDDLFEFFRRGNSIPWYESAIRRHEKGYAPSIKWGLHLLDLLKEAEALPHVPVHPDELFTYLSGRSDLPFASILLRTTSLNWQNYTFSFSNGIKVSKVDNGYRVLAGLHTWSGPHSYEELHEILAEVGFDLLP